MNDTTSGAGSQTLMRGLDVMEAVASGSLTLAEISKRSGLSRSTAYRLAASLVERGYLRAVSRDGFRLGPKLLELGHLAQDQTQLTHVSRDYLERLAQSTGDTVHLGILDREQALYLDKLPGQRRINISSRIGDRQPLTSTGIGKALMLDDAPELWRERLGREQATASKTIDQALWEERMRGYVAAGRAYDLEENEDQIRCVAAPLRDATGRIVGAISVSSAAQYMADARMEDLTAEVKAAAHAISRELGWRQRDQGEDDVA